MPEFSTLLRTPSKERAYTEISNDSGTLAQYRIIEYWLRVDPAETGSFRHPAAPAVSPAVIHRLNCPARTRGCSSMVELQLPKLFDGRHSAVSHC